MADIMFPQGMTAISLLPFVMVALGATLQMTTGVGLGLIAGPFLLFVMDGPSAIQVAILLNLFLSVIMLPSEKHLVDTGKLKRLTLWATVGIPVGAVFLISVSPAGLKLASGIVVLLAAIQLRVFKPKVSSTKGHARSIGLGGVVSGAMTGALAIPGPVALWALLSTSIAPQKTRATLRAYFVIAYALAFVTISLLTEISPRMLAASAMLTPAVLLGMVFGLLVRRQVSPRVLGWSLEAVLFLMAASLLFKGLAALS